MGKLQHKCLIPSLVRRRPSHNSFWLFPNLSLNLLNWIWFDMIAGLVLSRSHFVCNCSHIAGPLMFVFAQSSESSNIKLIKWSFDWKFILTYAKKIIRVNIFSVGWSCTFFVPNQRIWSFSQMKSYSIKNTIWCSEFHV